MCGGAIMEGWVWEWQHCTDLGTGERLLMMAWASA
jgi:hypothetical protein